MGYFSDMFRMARQFAESMANGHDVFSEYKSRDIPRTLGDAAKYGREFSDKYANIGAGLFNESNREFIRKWHIPLGFASMYAIMRAEGWYGRSRKRR